MSKKTRNYEGTRAAIRETAARLFTENGIQASSLADIAKAAELSKGTLYYHYPAKEALVADIAEDHLGRMTDEIFGWIDTLGEAQPASEAVAGLIDALFADEDTMLLHFALLSEALRGDEGLKKRFAAKGREWAVMLEVGSLKMAEPGAKRFRGLSKHFFALLDGFALHTLLAEEPDLSALRRILTEG